MTSFSENGICKCFCPFDENVRATIRQRLYDKCDQCYIDSRGLFQTFHRAMLPGNSCLHGLWKIKLYYYLFVFVTNCIFNFRRSPIRLFAVGS